MWSTKETHTTPHCVLTALKAVSQSAGAPYPAHDGELVLREQAVGFVHEEVSSDELLEAPVLALDESVRSLALCVMGNKGGDRGDISDFRSRVTKRRQVLTRDDKGGHTPTDKIPPFPHSAHPLPSVPRLSH